VTGAVNQNHPMIPSEPLAERSAHHFQIGARAMDHHHRRAGGIVRPNIEDVNPRAGDLDHPALRRINALQDQNTDMRDRQNRRENDYDHLSCPDDFPHSWIADLPRRFLAMPEIELGRE
jgi:hypothetical protein